MTVTVDEWQHSEAQILATASQGYKNLAHELEACINELTNTSNQLFQDQVTGPPGEFLNEKWTTWRSRSYPLINRLNALSGELSRISRDWESSYNSQKQAAADEKQRQEKEAKNTNK